MSDIDHYLTNVVNANLLRDSTVIYDPDRIPRDILTSYKHKEAVALMSAVAESGLERYPDTVIWVDSSQEGRPVLRGIASLIIMDEHKFRALVGQAIRSAQRIPAPEQDRSP